MRAVDAESHAGFDRHRQRALASLDGRERAAAPAGVSYSESLTAIRRVSASEWYVLPYAI